MPVKNYEDPMHYAARHDQAGTLHALNVRGTSPEVRDKTGATPLHVAATNGALRAMRKLAALESDLNSKDKVGISWYKHYFILYVFL